MSASYWAYLDATPLEARPGGEPDEDGGPETCDDCGEPWAVHRAGHPAACRYVHDVPPCPSCGERDRPCQCDIAASQASAPHYCDRCDGCGWHEGGATLRTSCEACGTTGVVDRAAGRGGAS